MSRSRSQAAELADFTRSIRWDDLDERVHTRVGQLVTDYLGVVAGGATAPSSSAAATLLDGVVEGRCTVVGRRARVPPEAAALLNGTAGHAMELDDVTRESSLHPGVVVIPAALAIGEAVDASLAQVGEAIVSGYEVMIRVGNALGAAGAYRRGFHPTSVAGVFGSATAAGLLLRLDTDRLTAAIGIAGTLACGSLEYLADGAWTKRLNAGWAAHSGIQAARLAAGGFTGPDSAIDGRLGLLHGYSDEPRPERLLDGLGTDFALMSVAIKPYACCRYNHGLIDAMLAIREETNAAPGDVRSIRLGVLTGGALLVADPITQKRRPLNVVDAQFSAPFAAVVALVTGRAGTAEFSDEYIHDPVIRDLMGRTECYTSAKLDRDYPAVWPAEVVVELGDGRTIARRVEHALGEPENPISDAALLDKFAGLAAAIGVGRETGESVVRFDPDQRVRELLEPFRTVPGDALGAQDATIVVDPASP